MKVLLIDDEPLARVVLRSFLERDPDITGVEECGDGAEAIRRLSEECFDLAFLDVQMPGVDGFAVLESARADVLPLVIFVTAFEEHALEAFAVEAVDYLLKPFDDRRFAIALERAKRRHRERQLSLRGRELAALLDPSAGNGTPRDPAPTIAVQSGSSVLRIDLAEVRWIEAQDKHVLFHASDAEPVRARQTLSEIERRLDPEVFLRVHRSCIVALERVAALEKTKGGAAYLRLDSGDRVVVSRSRVPVVRARLQNGG